jgi:hypothetical protein
VQQLREAFPGSCPYRYAILDGDAKYGQEVTDVLTTGGVKPELAPLPTGVLHCPALRLLGSFSIPGARIQA